MCFVFNFYVFYICFLFFCVCVNKLLILNPYQKRVKTRFTLTNLWVCYCRVSALRFHFHKIFLPLILYLLNQNSIFKERRKYKATNTKESLNFNTFLVEISQISDSKWIQELDEMIILNAGLGNSSIDNSHSLKQ